MIGASWSADLYGCKSIPESARELAEWISTAAREAGMKLYDTMGDNFPQAEWQDDHGASCLGLIVPLRESHLVIHTWPDKQLVSVDFYTCGEFEPAEKAFNNLIDKFDFRGFSIHGPHRRG